MKRLFYSSPGVKLESSNLLKFAEETGALNQRLRPLGHATADTDNRLRLCEIR